MAFEIVGMLVMYDEFDDLDKFNDRSVQLLRSRGLLSITKINIFARTFEDIMAALQDNSSEIYQRKRLTTLIISKIIHDSQLMM